MKINASFRNVLDLSRVRVRRDDLYVTELKTEAARQILRRRSLRPVAELFTGGVIRSYFDVRNYREPLANEKASLDQVRAKEPRAAEVSLLSVIKAAEFTVPDEQPVNDSLADLISTVLSPEAKEELAKSLSYFVKKTILETYPSAAFQLMTDEEKFVVLFNAAGEGQLVELSPLRFLAEAYLREKPNTGQYAMLWAMIEGGENDQS
ncbi:MAG: hypothetical protein WCW67_07355 [Candidatus Margulisiibacteriota bacterium]|jgi:hypothetical protein